MLMIGSNVPKDALVWYRNQDQAAEMDRDNTDRPLYLCHVVKLDKEKVWLRLTNEERNNYKGTSRPSLNVDSFETKVELTLDYSNNAAQGLPDMVDIDELNHATLMQNLQARYDRDEIYTYVGPIILAMNPFMNLNHKLYTDEQMEDYKKIIKSKTPYDDKKEKPPHIWTITSLAYRQMMELKTKQAIVISGESGSGKTENAKRAMKFLTSLGAMKPKPGQENDVPIEQKILDTNPVLEGFGNAKTVRNNNSSRFGKYVLLYYTQDKGEILGARVKNYLLEKSRIVGPTAGERNYHAFYQLLRGGDNQLLEELGLLDPITKRRFTLADFNFMKRGADVDQSIINDEEEYKQLDSQFKSLGFTPQEQLAIWKITAAVLHLGQIEFNGDTYNENGKPCSVENPQTMALIAKLLGIQDPNELQCEIVNKAGAKGQALRAPWKLPECYESRDSFAKSLFDNMFNWLVDRMNLTILPEGEGTDDFKNKTKTIGLLDIFGFECFDDNKFEQMCINYVNEKLHKLYISAIFDAEKFELKSEGLADKVSSLKYPDMTSLEVIKLLDEVPPKGGSSKVGPGQKAAEAPKMGLFTIVNDCCTQKPRPKSDVLMKKFEDQHKTTAVFQKSKDYPRKFKIIHSAKNVDYTIANFIDRNVDEISLSLEQCVALKAEKVISNIFSGIVVKPGQEEVKKAAAQDQKMSNKKTIWSKFSDQMKDLMIELAEPLFDLNKDSGEEQKEPKQGPPLIGGVPCENCQLHFIRCIKPNEDKKAHMFVHALTLQQITYMGVLESVDLKQKNFPYRKKYEEFYARYELLGPLYGTCRYEKMEDKKMYDFRDLSVKIVNDTLQQHCKEYYALGKTKVLMMFEVVALLDKAVQKARASRDEAANHVKRAFQIYKGLGRSQRNKSKLGKLQVAFKEEYQKRVKQRGHAMFEKVLLHVSKAVSKKKEELEQFATQVFVDTYRKYNFRRSLARMIHVRQNLAKFLQLQALIRRLEKIYIAYMITRQITDKAFAMSRLNANDKAVRTVQRIFRGFKARDSRMPIIIEAVKAKENLKLHMAARVVQKQMRGYIVRNRLMYMNLAAQKIQATVKMKWHRQFYLKLKEDAMTIQRCVRIFLTRRGVIKSRLGSYLSQEVSVLSKVRNFESQQLKQSPEAQMCNQIHMKPQSAYSTKKLAFFTKVLDMHVLTDLSDVYPKGWASSWNKVSGACANEEFPILYMAHGSTHTVAVNQRGKIYAWGWNDNGQCAKGPEIAEVTVTSQQSSGKQTGIFLQKDDLRIKQLVTSADRNFLILEESQNVIAWGGNEKGQLGLGNYQDQHNLNIMEFFSKQNIKVGMIAAGGDLTLSACENGEGYAWPFKKSGTTYSLPVKMPFSTKIKIQKVACGFNFGFFISSQGLVYAMGKENSEGQLGQGHTYPRDIPELIMIFKDIGERIDAIECGYKHVIAKSSLGKVYTWGWGSRGQLGLGHTDSEMSPRLLQIEKFGHKERVVQIAAGYSHSVIMLDLSRELLWFGTNAHLANGVSRPQRVKLSEHIPELFNELGPVSGLQIAQQVDFAAIKVTCSWSRTMSVTNILVADLRQVNSQHPWKKVNTAIQTLSQKWEPREIMPPFIDSLVPFFNIQMLRNQNKNKGSNIAQTTMSGPVGKVATKQQAPNNQSQMNSNMMMAPSIASSAIKNSISSSITPQQDNHRVYSKQQQRM